MKNLSLVGVCVLLLVSVGCNVVAVALDKEGLACQNDAACPSGYYCGDGTCQKGERPVDSGVVDAVVDGGGRDLGWGDGWTPDVGVPDVVVPDVVVRDLVTEEDTGVEDVTTGEDIGVEDAAVSEDAGVEDGAAKEDAAPPCVDEDGDGYYSTHCSDGNDCDDRSAAISPDGVEFPDDGKDQDCVGGDLRASSATEHAVHVDMHHANCSDGGRGTASIPNCTISAALRSASSGDSIFVAQGVYIEDLQLDKHIGLYGGYFGYFAHQETGWERDISFAPTEIVGNIISSSDLVMQGFTIHGRDGTDQVQALTVSGTGTHAFFADCEIFGGNTDGRAVGVRFAQTQGTVLRSKFYGGDGRTSTGMLVVRSQVTVVNSEIYSSNGIDDSYAVRIDSPGASTTFLHNYIKAGRAYSSYGVRIEENAAQVTLANNIIDPGSATTLAIGVFAEDVPAVLHNNNIYSKDMTCVLSSPGCWSIDQLSHDSACYDCRNNISEPPLIRNSALSGIRLEPSSPCRNAGVDPVTFHSRGLYERDAEGDARPHEDNWDIGPDEIFGLYVNPRNPACAENGGSWEVPTCSIGAALAMATQGQVIYVTQGTYAETLEASGLHSKMLGGYRSQDWIRNTRDYTVLVAPQIALEVNGGANIVLDGFGIMGLGDDYLHSVYALNLSESKLVVNDCIVFAKNGYSRAISITAGVARISHSEISASSEYGSTAISFDSTSLVLFNNRIFNRTEGRHNGALFNGGSRVTAYNNYIECLGESARCVYGVSDAAYTLINNIIDSRGTTGRSLGVRLDEGGAEVLLVNNILLGDPGGGYIGVEFLTGNGTLVNNLFNDSRNVVSDDNEESFGLSEVNGCSAWTSGCDSRTSGNISGDPALLGIHPPRIGPGSAGLAGGTTTALHGVVLREDFEGNRRSWETPDIGADELYGYFVNSADCSHGTGDRDHPVCEISDAIADHEVGRPVFAAAGTYTCPLDFPADFELYGGFDPAANWRRSDSVTSIAGSTGTECLRINGDNVVIQNVHVSGTNNHSGDSTGVWVAPSAGLFLADSNINAGTGERSYGVLTPGKVTLLRNQIRGGVASVGNSYGVFVGEEGEATAIGNVIEGGRSDNAHAWGLRAANSTVLVNNTIFGGDAALSSTAVELYQAGNHIVQNNILDCGTSLAQCNAASVLSGQQTSLYNNNLWSADQTCAFYDNEATSCVADANVCDWTSCSASAGNISTDHNLAAGEYSLTAGNACIDKGRDPGTIPELLPYMPLLSWDKDKELRPKDGDGDTTPQWDIGADEF